MSEVVWFSKWARQDLHSSKVQAAAEILGKEKQDGKRLLAIVQYHKISFVLSFDFEDSPNSAIEYYANNSTQLLESDSEDGEPKTPKTMTTQTSLDNIEQHSAEPRIICRRSSGLD